jgi:spore coat protein CotH
MEAPVTTHPPDPSPARRLGTVLLAPLLAVVATVGSGGAVALAQEAPALFDSSTVHDIGVTFDTGAYDAMIATFRETGEKDWIDATITIDGLTYTDAAMRLKGNSSLMSLRGRGGMRGPVAPDADPSSAPAGPGPMGTASAEEPEGLPWLIRLDRNVDGQNHQGYVDLVIRSNGSSTALNEAVGLELLEAAGLASQQAIAAAFAVNGSEPRLRLAIEHPDDVWMDTVLGENGALYKAESTGDFSYRGTDPDAYDEVFDQEAGKDVTDLGPLMELLRFINESDDATFAAELPARLDVDAFATYLAMMDLTGNFDDIDGPGNNAYLYWDAGTGVFTVVPWDMNLAFGGFGRGMGGGGFGEGRPGAGARPERPDRPVPDASGAPRVRGQGGIPGSVPDGAPGRFGRGNILVERFHADAGFEARYQERLVELRAELYASGLGTTILETWVTMLSADATHLVDAATIEQEAAAIAAQLTAD